MAAVEAQSGGLAHTALESAAQQPLMLGLFLPQAKGIIKLSIGEKPSVRGDLGTVKFQLQTAVEINPQRGLSAFTRRVTWGASVLMCVLH